MKHTFILSAIASIAFAFGSLQNSSAHCQVPCGIYDDPARITALLEHVTTIEKSMKQIIELSAEPKKNANQLVRWTNAKEHHSDDLSKIVTYYFMTQRIKPPKEASDKAAAEKYTKELTLLHHMLVHAMKCKQTTDVAHCEKLRGLITTFKTSYMAK
ncbi:MAG: superoxide dismutase [Ni] [Verrucomicrobiota bacterium]